MDLTFQRQAVGQMLRVLVSVERIEIITVGKNLAVHERLDCNNTWSLLPDHYLDLIQQRPMSLNSARPIRQWRAQRPESLHRLLGVQEQSPLCRLGPGIWRPGDDRRPS